LRWINAAIGTNFNMASKAQHRFRQEGGVNLLPANGKSSMMLPQMAASRSR
jgi:hypothetical protein